MNHSAVALLALPLIALSASAADIAFPIERPTLTVGDTWTYQWKAQKDTEKHIANVESKSESEYVLNVAVEGGTKPSYKETRSLDLGVKSTVAGKPVIGHWIDFPLTLGKTWSEHRPWVNSGGSEGWDDITYTIQGIERVTSPAGTFETVKVVGKGWWTNATSRRSGSIETSYWYSPAVKFTVRFERKYLGQSTGDSYFASEMISFKVQ